MSQFKIATPSVLVIAGIACAVGYLIGSARSSSHREAKASKSAMTEPAEAADTTTTYVALQVPKASPTAAIADRDVYYPGTEDLGPNEMRVTACGTGMPNARPKQAAAACWLVELGNGDKFLFDIGTGSVERIAALQIPYNYLNKVTSSTAVLASFWNGTA